MKFREKLNEYMERLSCSAKDLCALSGISTASFSRYKNGERVPEISTDSFEKLCGAIAKIAEQKKVPDISPDSVKEAFIACGDFNATDKETLRQNFNTLISELNINLARLSQYTNYDTSAIFRIRTGSRRPGDAEQFASAVASFVSREMGTAQGIYAVAGLIGCEPEKIYDLSVRYLGAVSNSRTTEYSQTADKPKLVRRFAFSKPEVLQKTSGFFYFTKKERSECTSPARHPSTVWRPS